MTEAEWLACNNTETMVDYLFNHKPPWEKSADGERSLRGRANARTLRLFAIACCRPAALPEDLPLLEQAESLVDRRTTEEEWPRLMKVATTMGTKEVMHPDGVFAGWLAGRNDKWRHERQPERPALLRDVMGNLLRPPQAIPPGILAWNDHTVPGLAQAIYDDRAFDRLPILSDALEEAGCTDFALLSHLRSPGPHVRGCWALDLILSHYS
jgi:hypothetical protein